MPPVSRIKIDQEEDGKGLTGILAIRVVKQGLIIYSSERHKSAIQVMNSDKR